MDTQLHWFCLQYIKFTLRLADHSFYFTNDKLSDIADVRNLYSVTATASQKRKLAFELKTADQGS